jgi:Zn finger protein HypA/HybF involved in hydrogenase expression
MNSVQMWKCPCGKRYKAMWHSTGTRRQRRFVCPQCKRSVSIDDGDEMQIQVEASPGIWHDLEPSR